MKEKDQKNESFQDNWAQPTYQTGSTQPPKSRGGLIAFLLVLVIFLCGISTGLGFMNIRLFRRINALEATETCSVVFSRDARWEAAEDSIKYPLGFSGQEVSPFWQSYHGLPAGIYVTEVSSSGGLLPGDILTEINGAPISGSASLLALLQSYQPGDRVDVTLCRNGQKQALTLTMEE